MQTCNRLQNWCYSAGLALVLAGWGQGEAPKVPSSAAPPATTPAAPQATPKMEAKGTLTLGDKTFKLAKALAYEVRRSDRKETVVILSEKPLDTAKLKQSLKKNGTDEGFFPFDAHVKLRFDDKGALSQTAIYADGANIIGSGNDNIKVTATVKDGTAKGKAGMEKPEKFFKMSYQFEVTFDVAVLQLAGAEPKPLADPITKKITPVEPGKSAVVTDRELRIEGKLAQNSPEVMGKPAQIHRVKMSAGKTYVIDLESKDFDSYLRILDTAGKQLAEDDDGGEGFNARLRFTPPKEGDYQVVATCFNSGQGNYVLKIRDLTPVDPGKSAVITGKELRIEGNLAQNSPEVMGKPAQIHKVKMSAGKTYVIDLESKDFDSYLRIQDAAGKQLAEDDDSGEGFNARLRFTPPKEGDYQVVATCFNSGQGNYVLKIRDLTPGEPGKPALVTEKELRFEGKLTNSDTKIMGRPAQIHRVKMSPGKAYVIDLESADFDAYLRILDSGGKQLASDDDSGGNRNARIRFTPAKEDNYQVVATRFGSGQGSYLLKIRVLRAGEEKQP